MLSRQLVRLTTDVPVEIDWSAARVGDHGYRALESLCEEFGFRRLTNSSTGLSHQSIQPNGNRSTRRSIRRPKLQRFGAAVGCTDADFY